MGIFQSSDYASCFGEVATKCNWRKGLIIDINSREQLYVNDIRPIYAGPQAGTLKIGENLTGTYYIYYYSGQNIDIHPFESAPLYEIVITKISDAKIGGARKEIKNRDISNNSESVKSIEDKNMNERVKDLIEFEDEKPNFLKDVDFSVGKQPHDMNIENSQNVAHDNIHDNIHDNTHKKNDIFKSADGRAPHPPSMKYTEVHPDDNIADD
jgi:hypothetical protein